MGLEKNMYFPPAASGRGFSTDGEYHMYQGLKETVIAEEQARRASVGEPPLKDGKLERFFTKIFGKRSSRAWRGWGGDVRTREGEGFDEARVRSWMRVF